MPQTSPDRAARWPGMDRASLARARAMVHNARGTKHEAGLLKFLEIKASRAAPAASEKP